MRTKLEIRVKDGNGGVRVLPAGLPVTFPEGKHSLCLVAHDSRPEKPYCVRVTSAFKAPSISTMEKWLDDGSAKSILGERVEPDGVDCHGSPSWMLALGII